MSPLFPPTTSIMNGPLHNPSHLWSHDAAGKKPIRHTARRRIHRNGPLPRVHGV
jgi:hypothetical protein